MREAAPLIPQFVSAEEGSRILLCYVLGGLAYFKLISLLKNIGLLPFLRIHGDVLQIPLYT
jgi:hypothetical protein